MKSNEFRKYLAYVKERRGAHIPDYYIEKDYTLSLFLSTWQSLKETGNVPSLDALIFKGGTLLIRNYLDYPRISEDLDFTHLDSHALRLIENPNKREGEIKKRIIPLLDEIKRVCDRAGFDFEAKRTNLRYVMVRNSRAVYVLTFYYHSLLTGEEIPVKIEVNFLEGIIHPYTESRINTIIESDVYLKSIGYNLNNISLKAYSLEEIILEKYRAILTRESFKERDLLDLYLIAKKGTDVFKTQKNIIRKKIDCGILIAPGLLQNLKKNCSLLHSQGDLESDDDVSRLTLVTINPAQYRQFKSQLFEKLKEVCAECQSRSTSE